MTREPRIACVIGSLDWGGAQRVMTILAGHWARQGWEVDLITFDPASFEPAYPLDAGVRHVPLDLERSVSGTWQAVQKTRWQARRLRERFRSERPDVVVSFLDHANIVTLLAARKESIPVFVSERVDPSQHRIGRRWHWLRELLYPGAAGVVVQTERVRDVLSKRIRANAAVIPNPVVPPAQSDAPLVGGPALPPGARTILAMGRLVPQKGFDLLLSAFGRVARQHADVHLVIWGEGNERERLEQQAAALEVADRFHLPGRTSQPGDAMREAELFVLSSRYEGFPNVLCEAMASGLPAVALDCPTGPREIIRDGRDGVLVPFEEEEAATAVLAQALGELLSSPDELARMGTEAREVRERFSLERVAAQWEELFAAAGVSSVAGPGQTT